MNGKEIKQKREALGLSQEALAHKIGVSTATAARWERITADRPEGLHKPSPMAEKRLKRLFSGVDVEE
jgi:DNA-binding transcriptional regulator YiaG